MAAALRAGNVVPAVLPCLGSFAGPSQEPSQPAASPEGPRSEWGKQAQGHAPLCREPACLLSRTTSSAEDAVVSLWSGSEFTFAEESCRSAGVWRRKGERGKSQPRLYGMLSPAGVAGTALPPAPHGQRFHGLCESWWALRGPGCGGGAQPAGPPGTARHRPQSPGMRWPSAQAANGESSRPKPAPSSPLCKLGRQTEGQGLDLKKTRWKFRPAHSWMRAISKPQPNFTDLHNFSRKQNSSKCWLQLLWTFLCQENNPLFPGRADVHHDFCASSHASLRHPSLGKCVASHCTQERLVLQPHFFAHPMMKGNEPRVLAQRSWLTPCGLSTGLVAQHFCREDGSVGPRPWASAAWGATLRLAGWELAKSEQSGASSSGASWTQALLRMGVGWDDLPRSLPA